MEDSKLKRNILSFFQFTIADYSSFLQQSTVFSLPLLVIFVVQFGSLCPSNIFSENLKSIFHVAMWDGIIQEVRLESLMENSRFVFSIVFASSLTFLNTSFLIFQILATRSNNPSLYSIVFRVIMVFFQVFSNIAMIPALDLAIKDFKCTQHSSNDPCFGKEHTIRMLLAIIIVMNIYPLNTFYRYFPRDLKFITRIKTAQKDTILTSSFSFVVFLMVLLSNFKDQNFLFRIVANTYHFLVTLWFIVDYFLVFHFWFDPTISLVYFSFWVFCLWESIFNLIHALWHMMGSTIDLDLLTVGVFFAFLKLSWILRMKVRQVVFDKSFYNIKSLTKASLYIQLLMSLSGILEGDNEAKFELLSVLGKHISNCRVPECQCKLVKNEEFFDQTSEKFRTKREEVSTMTNIKNAYTNRLPELTAETQNENIQSTREFIFATKKKTLPQVSSVSSYSIDPAHEKLLGVFEVFYLLKLQNHRGKVDNQFIFDLLSFLVTEKKSYVRALLIIHSYRSKWKRQVGFHNQIMINNYLNLAKQLSNAKIQASGVYCMRNSFSELLQYTQEIEKIDEKCYDLYSEYIELFNIMGENGFPEIEAGNRATHIMRELVQIEKGFKSLFAKNKWNIQLLTCFVNYRARIAYRTGDINEYYDAYFETINRSKKRSTKKDMFPVNGQFDFLSTENTVILAAQEKSRFLVKHYTRNCLKRFEYQKHSFDKIDIKKLMPKYARGLHDKILQDKIEKKNKNKIHHFSTLLNFAVTNRELVFPVSMFLKFELNQVDGIFAAALLRRVKTNSHVILISESGIIMHMSKGLMPLIERDLEDSLLRYQHIIRNRSSVFQFLPSLAELLLDPDQSHFEPSLMFIKATAKQKTMTKVTTGSGKKRMKRTLGKNLIWFANNSNVLITDPKNKTAFESLYDVARILKSQQNSFVAKTWNMFTVLVDILPGSICNEEATYTVLEIKSVVPMKNTLKDFFVKMCEINKQLNEIEFPMMMRPSLLFRQFKETRKILQRRLNQQIPINFEQRKEKEIIETSEEEQESILDQVQEISDFPPNPRNKETSNEPLNSSSRSSSLSNESFSEQDVRIKKEMQGGLAPNQNRPLAIALGSPGNNQKENLERMSSEINGLDELPDEDRKETILDLGKDKKLKSPDSSPFSKRESEIEDKNFRIGEVFVESIVKNQKKTGALDLWSSPMSFLDFNKEKSDSEEFGALVSSKKTDENGFHASSRSSSSSQYGSTSFRSYWEMKPDLTIIKSVKLVLKLGFLLILVTSLAMSIGIVLIDTSLYQNVHSAEAIGDIFIPISVALEEVVTQLLVNEGMVDSPAIDSELLYHGELSSESFADLKEAILLLFNKDSEEYHMLDELLKTNTTINLPSESETVLDILDSVPCIVSLIEWLSTVKYITGQFTGEDYSISRTRGSQIIDNYFVLEEDVDLVRDFKKEDIFELVSFNTIFLYTQSFVNLAILVGINFLTLLTYMKVYSETETILQLFSKIDRSLIKKYKENFIQTKISIDKKREKNAKSHFSEALDTSWRIKQPKKVLGSHKTEKSMTASEKSQKKKPKKKKNKPKNISHSKSSEKQKRNSLARMVLLVLLASFLIGLPIFIKMTINIRTKDQMALSSEWLFEITDFKSSLHFAQVGLICEFLWNTLPHLYTQRATMDEVQSDFQVLYNDFTSRLDAFLATETSDTELGSFLYLVMNENFCEHLGLTEEVRARCVSSQSGLEGNGVGIAVSSFKTFLGEVQAEFDRGGYSVEAALAFLKNVAWLEYKNIVYFSVITWDIAEDLLLSELNQTVRITKIMQVLMDCLFGLAFLLLDLFVRKRLLKNKSEELDAMQKAILALPPEILQNNNYVKNYCKNRFQV